jgi:feruloyl esterase
MRFILLLLSLLVNASAMAAQQSETQCRNLYRLTDLAYAVEPGRVFPAADSLPSHCKVRAVINRAIQVEVTMPLNNWNGRMMFSTVGGGAGSIGDITSLLSRGFAMASTDTGHEGNDFDYAYQPEALIDYAYRGVHLATQFAKATIERYYDEKISYSYLKGCSNGGRAALLEATRFPDDYDGIIAGAPVFRFREFMPCIGRGHCKTTRQQTRNVSNTSCTPANRRKHHTAIPII